jgi:hypothetical protein
VSVCVDVADTVTGGACVEVLIVAKLTVEVGLILFDVTPIIGVTVGTGVSK